jgi:hypothetical protein
LRQCARRTVKRGIMAFLQTGGVIWSIISILVGIIIIIWPHIIAYVIGIYLVIIGILGLIAALT